MSLDKGVIQFAPYEFQKKIINTVIDERFTIVKASRQLGKTTTFAAFFVWYVLFNRNKKVAILAHKEDTAKDILARVKMAYEHIPHWMQQGVVTWNKTSIELENQSSIMAAATSSGSVRGQSYNCILLDEFAHVPTGIAQEFFESVLPTITSGATSKLVINSTPKGLNMFHKMWKDAVNKKNGFVPIDVHYSEVPGRDRKWAETTRKAIGEDKFKQEFDTQFIGSTATLVVASKLETLTDTPPVYSNEEGLRIFKQPMKNRSYVLTADVSGGNGADYQATSVFDISKMPYEQVATYRNNRLSPLLYPNIIEQLGKKYNDALVLVEMNNEGSQVSNILRLDLEYENVATINTRDNKQEISGGFGSNIRHGLLMNKQTKRIGCSNLKAMVESDQLLINDLYTINELLTFVAKNASYAADTEEDHDDMVMTLVSFAWLAAQPQFKELTDLDLRKRMFKDEIARIEQEFLPFGFVVGDTYDTPDLVSPDAVWSKVS